ncbi:ankyrin repeat domain-containing protein SOWAHD [Lepisosteus oculatus]|uniref:ankyrin repeat domain-containing protein SOWAHD n=1 Tax=Lepisosteus oculatus TaxID=7918 RepID=UPI0037166369
MGDSAGVSEPPGTVSPGAHLDAYQAAAASPPVQEEEEEGGEEGSRCAAAGASDGGPPIPRAAWRAAGGTGSREERAPRLSARACGYASARRAKLQRQPEVSETDGAPCASLTPAMRKKYLKELFLHNGLHNGLGSILVSSQSSSAAGDCGDEAAQPSTEDGNLTRTFWALDPVEHAWMLSVVDGNYDTIVEFLSEDPSLLTRKDFVSGFTVMHWLAKHGKDETLIKVMRYAESRGLPVNIDVRASGGLTPLHVAAMHGRHMVVKILVGAYSASVDAMDHGGRRAWQYLRGDAPAEMRELLGAMDEQGWALGPLNTNNNSADALSRAEPEAPGRKGQLGGFASFKRMLSPLLSFVSRSSREPLGTAQ